MKISIIFFIYRAEDFYRMKLQRNIFVAWRKQRPFLRHEANKLCRKHLLVKAMKGLNFAMKRRKATHEYLIYERNAALMKKCWQTVNKDMMFFVLCLYR